MPEDKARIAKIISRSGFCSRRQAEELIFAGEILFNGQKIKHPSLKISFNEAKQITINGQSLPPIEPTEIYLFHKPVKCLTSRVDEKNLGRKTIYDFLPKHVPKIPIGRLDYMTEGLLLLTNDGEFARNYELPKNQVTRTYLVETDLLSDEKFFQISNLLKKPLKINKITYEVQDFARKRNYGKNWIQVKLSEGKNREIRNIFQHFNLKIRRLIRISHGNFELNNLKPGELKKTTTISHL